LEEMSNIESESLEAHVELCSERYSHLEEKIDDVVRRIERSYVRFDKVEKSLDVIQEFATNHHTDRFQAIDTRQEALEAQLSGTNKLILGGAITIIATLIGSVITIIQ
tara:strand:+ start:109 stop:432 length:324 start_codon:yes stop_codon:yes gene_type:complete